MAIKIGSLATGSKWEDVYEECKRVFDQFNWRDFFDVSVWNILKPLFVGFVLIGLALGAATYFTALWFLLRRQEKLLTFLPPNQMR
jgi:hypothetical protein